MAKVTEQDLIKLGFQEYRKSMYCKEFKHQILNGLFVTANVKTNIARVYISPEWAEDKPLTPANLKLFIDFAEGKQL